MSEGMKHDQGKTRYDLLPMEAVDQVAQVLTFGAKKYAPNNWKHVAEPESRYMAAAMRHVSAHMQGEVLDAESGLSHLAHATTCLMFLLSGQSDKEQSEFERHVDRITRHDPRPVCDNCNHLLMHGMESSKFYCPDCTDNSNEPESGVK